MSSTADTDPAALPKVGRWEWRAFGEDIAQAERHLTALQAERDHESDDLYVLSAGSDASVKLRDGVVDVKELQRVRPDGLQQWKPVLKAPLPLDAGSANRVLTALGIGATLDIAWRIGVHCAADYIKLFVGRAGRAHICLSK